MTTTHWYDKCG